MTEYKNIKEALTAIIDEYGAKILNNDKLFIAVLSDYAVDFPNEQRLLRKYIRNGFLSVINQIINNDSENALKSLGQSLVQAESTAEERTSFFHFALTLFNSKITDDTFFNVGLELFRNIPKNKYVPIALLFFNKSAEQNNAEAMLYLSNIYFKGKGIDVNNEKALSYLKKAADLNNEKAKYELALRYKSGEQIEKDLRQAVSLLKTIDKPYASFELGEIYSLNFEYEKAFSYYLDSAKQGNVYAQYTTAICLVTGKGTKRDVTESKKWLILAAKNGHNGARTKLKELGETWD